MSIKKFFTISILLFLCFNLYSQTRRDYVNIFVDFEKDSENIAAFTKAKDGGGISLGVYREGFDSKKARDRVLKKQTKKGVLGVVPGRIPSVSVNFMSFKSPEFVSCPDYVDSVTVDEFRNNTAKYINAKKTYIVYEDDNGGCVRWDVNFMPEE